MVLQILVILLIILGSVIYIVYDRGKDAPFVPTEPDVLQRVIDLAEIKKGDVVYDLGAGDGRFVIAAAMKGAKAYGVETNFFRVLYARLWIFILGLTKNAHIIRSDLFDVPLKTADVVICYLLQETNDKLQKKLEKELKKGARVVSVAFEFKGWKIEKFDIKGPIYGPLRLYIV